MIMINLDHFSRANIVNLQIVKFIFRIYFFYIYFFLNRFRNP